MKKALLILAAVMFTMTASAQLKFGLKGGVNVTDMKFEKEVFNADNKVGFFVGPTIKFTLPIIGLGIDAAALYDQREADIDLIVLEDVNSSQNSTTTIKRKALNIPINLRYGVGLGSLAEVFLKAGPQFGFNIGDKEVLDSYKDWTWKTSEFSVNLGAGVTVASHLELAFNYNIVCGKTSEMDDVYTNAKNGWKNQNNAWQISAAYYF